MADNIARTIAALRPYAIPVAVVLRAHYQSVNPEDILALCDAAERGLRKPRGTTRLSLSAPARQRIYRRGGAPMFLTPDELERLTGRRRFSAQRRALAGRKG